MLALEEGLHYASEVVKIVGGLASFYAVYKLREIEKKYLFKATMPELITRLDSALGALNDALISPSSHRTQITEALNYLVVDVKNIRRKARGDSLRACDEFLDMIQTTKPKRFFLFPTDAPPVAIGKVMLVEIYGKGRGLIRSLQNDMEDYGWSGK